MPPINDTLTLTAGFDRSLAWYKGASVRYLCVEIAAAEAVRPEAVERVPLNLGVVIDASGSMSGHPIAAAKQGTSMVLGRLADADRFSLVSFDFEPTTHVSGRALTSNRERIASLIERIEPGGNTNLSGGWLAGAVGVAEVMETGERFRSQIMLLSDGHANAGIVDPGELAHHAEQLRRRGITSSAIGIGDGYSALQLEAIASSGGGRMHRADSADEIVEVLLGELDESENTVAEDVTIAVAAAPGADIKLLSAFPARWTSAGLAVSAGSLAGGRRLPLVFQVQTPAGSPGDMLAFTISGSWRTPGAEGARLDIDPSAVHLSLAQGKENNAQPRDEVLSTEAARTWQMSIVRQAVQMNRERRGPVARAYVQGQLGHFRRYCEGLAGTGVLITELEELAARIDIEWDERSRQEVQLSSYKLSRGEREVRASAPPSWADSMPPSQQGRRKN